MLSDQQERKRQWRLLSGWIPPGGPTQASPKNCALVVRGVFEVIRMWNYWDLIWDWGQYIDVKNEDGIEIWILENNGLLVIKIMEKQMISTL